MQVIAFDGSDDRSGPLSWSQKSMWNNIQRLASNDQHLNQLIHLVLPQPVSMERVSAALRTILRRHESLRTTYPLGPDGVPVQKVRGGGEVSAHLYDQESPDLGERFDVANQLPLRLALGLRGRLVDRVNLCLSHMATDAYSNRILRAELKILLSESSDHRTLLEEPTAQPLDIAHAQQAASADQRYQETYAYWREVMTQAPDPPFDIQPRTPASPRFWHGRYLSGEMYEASRALAKYARMSESAIILAALLEPLSNEMRYTRFPLWIRSSNRFRPEVKRSVTYLCQNVPVVVDVAPSEFLEFAGRVHRTIMQAYRHGEYDPDVATSILPGGVHYQAMTYNAVARPRTPTSTNTKQFQWIEKFEHEKILLFANAFLGSGISLLADTAILSPDQLESCLRRAERIIVSAAAASLQKNWRTRPIEGRFIDERASTGIAQQMRRHHGIGPDPSS
ncbi:condensation domain-containing protein [Nonomuraea turcica]|uniref:condensation domain-containing protein n=1 Tax=Nonomuraea sp. G32 TaxID=3067274 RepID=UPI00273AAA8D|nr:condensation domain-containing protein [Nonomuraea sp. G32]MDP4500502.1 condensation domain-containing protein [Nonomuraea sp. G32]